jgi:hypothetical protein
MPRSHPPEFRRKVLDLIAAGDCTKPGGTHLRGYPPWETTRAATKRTPPSPRPKVWQQTRCNDRASDRQQGAGQDEPRTRTALVPLPPEFGTRGEAFLPGFKDLVAPAVVEGRGDVVRPTDLLDVA